GGVVRLQRGSPATTRRCGARPASTSARDYAPWEHAFLSRMDASGLRGLVTLRGPGSRAAYLADLLLGESEEFRTLWDAHACATADPLCETRSMPVIETVSATTN